MIKIRGCAIFTIKNEGGRRRNEGGGDKGYSSNHKLNIIDKFTNDIHRMNFSCL